MFDSRDNSNGYGTGNLSQNTVSYLSEDIHGTKGDHNGKSTSEMKSTDQNEKSPGFLGEVLENTSLHGLRSLANTKNRLARVIWFMLVLSCIGVLCYQMVDRIIYYYTWPITVNVQINYNSSMRFPAVTICNQNAFKATTAAEKGWFNLVHDLHSSRHRNGNATDMWQNGDVPMDIFYKELAHKKEDFIVKCDLGSVECSVDSFDAVITDHGVCYTFSYVDSVSSPGPYFGEICPFLLILKMPAASAVHVGVNDWSMDRVSEWLDSCSLVDLTDIFQGIKCGPWKNTGGSKSGWGSDFNHASNDIEIYALEPIGTKLRKPVCGPAASKEHGLSLTLNVEQYEYMPGPHDAAGVKLLLHGDKEFPLVHELGSAIPTGAHAFVGVTLLQLGNLPEPHGECSSGQLNYFKTYTSETCRVDREMKEFEHKCNCLPPFAEIGKKRICSLSSYYLCGGNHDTHALEEGTDLTQSCPIPCNTTLYEPSISYASVSEYAMDKFLNDYSHDSLFGKLLQAKEVKYRYEGRKLNKTKRFIQKFKQELFELETVIRNHLCGMIQQQIKNAREIHQQMKYAWSVKERIYRYQEYVVRKNFIRPNEAAEERNLHILYTGFTEFSLYVDAGIQKLQNETDKTQRDTFYWLLTTKIENRMEVVRRAQDNFTQLIDAYRYGKPIFRYKFEDIPRSHNNAIVPKELLKRALDHNSYAVDHVVRFSKYLKDMLTWLGGYKNLTDTAFFDRTLNSTDLILTSSQYLRSCRNVLFSRSVVNREVLEWSLGILNARLESFRKLWAHYHDDMSDLLTDLDNLNNTISSRKNSFLNNFYRLNDADEFYLHNSSAYLYNLSNLVSRDEIRAAESNFKLSISEIRTSANFVYDTWPKVKEQAKQIWTQIIDDTDAQEYYNFTDNYQFLNPLESVLLEIEANYTAAQKEQDIREGLQNQDQRFLDAYEDLSNYLKNFQNSITIDGTFFKSNFLQVDIFYRQLSFEHVEQQVAYDGFALLCDIGGTMGLFVGASVLTIFEILDVVFRQFFRTKLPAEK